MDFTTLFKNIPQPIVVISPGLEILAATDSYLEITLQSRENIIGKKLLDVFPDNPESPESNNADKLKESLNKTISSGKTDNLGVLRYDIPKPGGGFVIRFWEAIHEPVISESGEVLYVIQSTNDVTERETTKIELSESEEKFKFLADSLPLLVATNNSIGKSTYFNESWEKYTGISAKELLSGKWKEAIHPDDINATTRCWDEAFETGNSCQLEFRIKDRNGNYRWHLNRYMPMSDTSGKIVMWIGSATDIHDTKLMVQELLQTNEEMSEMADQVQEAYNKADAERKVLKNLIMRAPAFCCMLRGPKHVFELVNDEYQKLFPERDLLNKPLAEVLPEMVSQGFIDLLDNVYNTGESYTGEEKAVKIDRHNTGKLEEIYVTFIYQPLYNETHKITGILVFGYEVTDKVKYEINRGAGGSETKKSK